MASNTKYAPAPTRDSFEDQPTATSSYTQAPPSYQAEPIIGDSRSEDDNLPDDFKEGLLYSQSPAIVDHGTFGGLLLQQVVQRLDPESYSTDEDRQKRKSYPMNLIFLAGFTGLEAYSISVITSFYDAPIVIQALIFTLGIFIALTLFACQTKYDFTSWIPYLFGALWVLVIFGFMSAFFPRTSGIELGYGVVAALLFSGYILVDTQLVMRHYHVEEEIAAAISLYLDIINLFLAILRILNSQQNN
nr:bax inhibitor 1 [Quercus suber]